MGDSIHLEKMGSELKCPICLSLVSSAVSLPCNHVFCHCCIEKSMKSCSSCPVCKLPYRRREVRPVPHMDNLVSIYKSMEAASGFNIFVTQNAALADLTDGENQVKSSGNNAQENTRVVSSYKAKKKQTFGKKLQKPSKSVVENNDSTTVNPSFPNKKRVQVPLTILSETPIQLAKNRSKMANIINEEPKKSSSSWEEKLVVKEKEEGNLSPFFWLRDEDVEMSSQHTDSDQLSNGEAPMPNVPSFSDIKDLDDENGIGLTPTEAQSGANNVADLLDSEMFEWTQRPCSPELCTSPLKMQVEGINGKELKDASDFGCGKENETLSKINSKNKRKKKVSRNSRMVSSLKTNTSIHTRGNKSRKKQLKEKQGALSESADTTETSPGNSIHSKKMAKNSEQMHACPIINNSLAIATRSKNNKKIQSRIGDIAVKSTVENVLAISFGAESLDGDENIASKRPASLDMKDHEDFSSKKIKNNNCWVRSKKQKVEPSKNKMLEILPVNQNTVAQPLLSFCAMAGKTGKLAGESVSNEALARKRKVKPSINNSTDDQLVHDLPNGNVNAHGKPGGQIEGNLFVRDVDGSGTVQKLSSLSDEIVSRRCESIKILCAFCHSSEETETTGEIVHYSHGRPIASDGCSSDAKIIHSHQSCTEWAPNVYFENDTAINLEAEVKRSRRIKCSCCGIRGASLGCYDKSCRKSFHVPCARLIPQCRWDADNFVMLCPLHPDTKFPCDSSGIEHKKKESTPKGHLGTKRDSISIKNKIEDSRNWNNYGSSKKLVLCCSSLTTAEKETVSDFERLSRVTVLKKWDASVTHVIASTDENGSCKRTIKVLMAILEGKWVLNVAWIKSCFEVMKIVDETSYEITVDTHGFRDGPRVGRLRAINKQPKLFAGLEFFFMGDFVPSYKGYLQELVIAGGGTTLQRKPKNCNLYGSPNTQTLIIYSLELPDKCDPRKGEVILNHRRLEAEAVATSTAAKVATNSWLLNSIAACKLQDVVKKKQASRKKTSL